MTADGHTEEGKWIVKLELTKDMVDQLARLLDMAKMMDGHDIELRKPGRETMDIIAYRAFLQEILNLLYKAMAEQQPFKEPLDKEPDQL